MSAMRAFTLFALSAGALADLSWYSDSTCGEYLNGESFNCGQSCTAFYDFEGKATGVHSVEALGLEPNTQVVLYASGDCSGDPYTAIGQAYGSKAGEDQCVASSGDALRSYEVLVYDSTGGGSACPPGTMSVATTNYPAPTG